MSYVVLGCDLNNSNDSKWQNTVKAALEKEGHKVEKLQIHPTPFGEYSYQNKAKGKIGVYIMADSLVSVADLAYGGTQFKYAYFIIRGDLDRPRMKTMEHFENNPIGRDLDCTSICNKLAGKSYGQMNKIIKNKCQITFGRNPEEGANNLIKLMGGEVSNSSKSSSSSSIKQAMKDVLYGWDGEAECFIIDDTVYIQKIRPPSKTKLSIIEGVNVDLNSVNVTDVKPSTVNYLTCDFKDYELTIKDDYSIKRFGEIRKEVKLDKTVKTLDDAKEFLQRAWTKIKRDNGHVVECSVHGSSVWKPGWVRVYLPSFHIDDYMYISKISQDDDGEWTCNLTLVDYPPSFGKPTNSNSKKKEK